MFRQVFEFLRSMVFIVEAGFAVIMSAVVYAFKGTTSVSRSRDPRGDGKDRVK